MLVLLIAALPACGRDRKEYPEAPPYREHPQGEFPITASYGFYGPYMTDQQVEWAKDAGFNNLNKTLHRQENTQLLELAERHDIPLILGEWGTRDTTKTRDIVTHYKDHPLVWGFSLFDEPNASQFEDLRKAGEKVLEYAPGQNFYINLLPVVSAAQLGAKDYRTYVEDYVATVNPPFISYDIYPIREGKGGQITVNPIYYETMEVVRDVARESGRPFWSYILSNKHWSYPKPTREFLRFQIFSALGYGSQGILYYTYLMPDFDKGVGEYSYAPIDWDGNRTDVWYMARDVNREVHNLEKVFLGADVVDVTHTGARIPDATRRSGRLPEPFGIIDSDGEGLQLSHIVNGRKEYLMVVNRDVVNRQKVYLSRSRPVKRLYGNGKEKMEKKPDFTIDPGGYAVFEIK